MPDDGRGKEAGRGIRLPDSWLEELRRRTPVSGVVGRRVKLVRSGREFKACCPFHNEKTPSFYVNDDKGFFHCFGCGVHGDAIGFVMRLDGLEFIEAARLLGGAAGLALPKSSPEDEAAERARGDVLGSLAAAQRIYAQALRPGSAAHEYATKARGLTAEEIERWGLGYAGGDVAIAALRREGFPNEILRNAGLLAIREGDGQAYPFFRDRLVFPVRDARGRTLGFGARAMGDGHPKYLNSPASSVFDKGRTLFGVDVARSAGAADLRGNAHRVAPLVVGEGYFDAIALTGLGYRGVAPNGTALTEGHLGELWRLDGTPVLAFDGDAAGWAAMGRAILRALPLAAPFRSLRFARLPAGEDPDSARRKGQGEQIRASIDAAFSLSDGLFALCADGLALDTAEGRAGCEARLRTHIATIGDATLRDSFLRTLVYDQLRSRLRVVPGGRKAPRAAGWVLPDPAAAGARARADLRRAIVAAVLRHAAIVETMRDEIEALGEDVEGLGEALGDPVAYADTPAGAALLADGDLARRVRMASADACAADVNRGLRFAIERLTLDRLEAELALIPDTDDAPGWSAFIAKTQLVGEMRERLALAQSGDEDEA